MISIDTLASRLEQTLNEALQNEQNEIFSEGYFQAGTRFLFKIFSKEGKYKKADRDLNTVTKYINGIITTLGGDKVGYNAESLVTTARMKLDLLIPWIPSPANDLKSFYEYVEDFLNNVLSIPTQELIADPDSGLIYYAIGNYSPLSTGLKDIREAVGESMTASIYITYTFVAQGVSSAETEIYVNDHGYDARVYPSRIDISRNSTTESFLPSDSQAANGTTISKTKAQGTGFQINIIKPEKFDALDAFIRRYLMTGAIETIQITIKEPDEIGVNAGSVNVIKASYTYDMIIADVTKGLDGVNSPVYTVALVEYLKE